MEEPLKSLAWTFFNSGANHSLLDLENRIKLFEILWVSETAEEMAANVAELYYQLTENKSDE
jgi:NAD-specific glutamate dehydrogenase